MAEMASSSRFWAGGDDTDSETDTTEDSSGEDSGDGKKVCGSAASLALTGGTTAPNLARLLTRSGSATRSGPSLLRSLGLPPCQAAHRIAYTMAKSSGLLLRCLAPPWPPIPLFRASPLAPRCCRPPLAQPAACLPWALSARLPPYATHPPPAGCVCVRYSTRISLPHGPRRV